MHEIMENLSWKSRVARSFSAASCTYDASSALQAQAAWLLTSRVLRYAWNHPNVLEVGCGTGGLTQLLMPHLPGNWIISDLSPAMVQATQHRLSTHGAQFRVMDGENPDLPAASLDLIVSNLTVQWFENLPHAFQRMTTCLAIGGRLLLTTLGEGSLQEWRHAVSSTGHDAGTPRYPSVHVLAEALPQAQIASHPIKMLYANALEFLRSLKGIGATTPLMGYRPLPVPALKHAMKKLGSPCQINYEILILDWVKQ